MAPRSDPHPDQLESFWDFREYFRGCMCGRAATASAETAGEYTEADSRTPLNEHLIQSIWANQLIQPEGLRLADGRPVRVVDQGRWNGSAGPDFKEARIMIGPDVLSGDIEIHLAASDWRAHRHQSDLDYNGCVLHVVLNIDDQQVADQIHNGNSLPRLELEPYLFPDLDTIRRSMTPDDYLYERPPGLGKCYDLMTTQDASLIARFLDRAGDERLRSKVQRLRDQIRGEAIDQVFHQSMMMSLGTGPGKSLYYLLAKRASWRELLDYVGELAPADRRAGLESILLHVAGLVPQTEDDWDEDSPDEAREYAAQLGKIWTRFEPYWSDRRIMPTRRWYRGIRPVNFPTRRLAAVAHLIDRSLQSGNSPLADLETRVRQWAPELEKAKPARRLHPAVKELVEWFEVESAPSFWSTHYSFKAKPAGQSMRLLGGSTAKSLVFNAVLPALALSAREQNDTTLAAAVYKLFAIFPTLQSNHITEFMSQRLFGDSERANSIINTERRRQALFQVFYACCSSEPSHCDSCYYMSER